MDSEVDIDHERVAVAMDSDGDVLRYRRTGMRGGWKNCQRNREQKRMGRVSYHG